MHYAHGGRPSIDPIVFFKLQLVMFFEGIRSERLLMRHAADRLSILWYLGYDLDEPLPDHSSLTKIRTRYGLEVFRRFFEAIVEQCQEAGLVWGQELYFDGTKVAANAGKESVKPRFAVEAYLNGLFETDVVEPGDEAEQQNAQEELAGSDTLVPLPVSLSPETYEELSQHNAARHDWIEEEGAQDRQVKGRTYQRIADYQVSTTDPDATIMHSKGGLDLGYHTHYVVDGGRARIIVAALVTPSEVMDNQPMLDLLWRTRFRWKLWPLHVTGDKKYGTEENLVAIEDQGIRAYIPVPDMDHRTEFFSSKEFQYDAERDIYVCPAGIELHFAPWHSTERSRRYRAYAKDCNHCPLKAQCTTGKQGRSLCRSVDEKVLERVRAYQQTEPYKKALRKRQVWVEPLFAEGKDWHGMRRFRLRRLWRVNCEALMRASGQNLKRLLTQRGWGRRPYPAEAVSVLFLASCAWVTRFFGGVGLSPRLYAQIPQQRERNALLFTDELCKSLFQQAEYFCGVRDHSYFFTGVLLDLGSIPVHRDLETHYFREQVQTHLAWLKEIESRYSNNGYYLELALLELQSNNKVEQGQEKKSTSSVKRRNLLLCGW